MKMSNNPLCAIEISRQQIETEELKKELGKYIYLINNVRQAKVSGTSEFRDVYHNFFTFRGKLAKWEVFLKYCEYMQECVKKNRVEFKEILGRLHDDCKIVTPVFSSKLLSMLNPDMPVWDSVVVKNLGLEKEKPKHHYLYQGKKYPNIDELDEFYSKICSIYEDFFSRRKTDVKKWTDFFDRKIFNDWYNEYIRDDRGTGDIWKICISWFREKKLSKEKIRASITDVKIVDLLLWQSREQ